MHMFEITKKVSSAIVWLFNFVLKNALADFLT